MPFNPLNDVAYQALTHGYATGYIICAAAAFVAAVVAFAAMSGQARGMEFTETIQPMDL